MEKQDQYRLFYNLNKDIASKLKKLNIISVQVTLDGPKDIHDSRRYLCGGGQTFEKIVSVLKNSDEMILKNSSSEVINYVDF